MNAMKIASIIVAVVLVIYTALLLSQLWGDMLSGAVFIKITITAAVVVVVTLGLAMLYREYIEEKNMKDDGYLD
jgi:membrane protein YdbS with pleckstrin-like domain